MDKVLQLIKKEEKRQKETLMMIASENYTYPEVYKAVGSVLMHKYSEGQVSKRYYQGNENIDAIETLCKERALSAFGLKPEKWGVNVQALSGTPANVAIFNALLEPGDKIMAMYLYDGGHLSHGWHYKGRKITLTSKIWDINFYYVEPKKGVFNYAEIEKQAVEQKPKMIISGGTAYPREIDHKKLSQIAKKVGAYYLADVSHEAGLIAGGANKSPFSAKGGQTLADVVMMTTHKTLRGPRGALIFSRSELSDQIDSGVFPGLQGGPHNHTIAGIAIALQKAINPEFKKYALQTVLNAKVLAAALSKKKFKLVSGGTDKHLVVIDLSNKDISGWFAGWALEYAGIIVNRSTIPSDPASPYYPSGLRIGTQALTARGMKESEMRKIAGWIDEVIKHIGKHNIPQDPAQRLEYLKSFKKKYSHDKFLIKIRMEVKALTDKFPLPK